MTSRQQASVTGAQAFAGEAGRAAVNRVIVDRPVDDDREAELVAEESEIESSLTVKRVTEAGRDQVWSVMADGWTYSQWVVGNSRMRAVDPNWPQVGSTIRHSVGVWPLLLDDLTVVLECVPTRKLVLLAKGRPFGKARITLRLFDIDGGGCRIEMSEVPVGAPMGWVPQKAALAAAFPRNRECTWRLAAIAERRTPAEMRSHDSE